MEIHPPHGPITSFRDFLLQLGTITAGVLIALSLEGLLEWNHYRRLAQEARETITREIADNKKEIDDHLAAAATRQKNLDEALRFANEMLETKSSGVRHIELELSLVELGSASWQTAERTGALAHMEYSEVQRYARVYEFQNLSPLNNGAVSNASSPQSRLCRAAIHMLRRPPMSRGFVRTCWRSGVSCSLSSSLHSD